MILFWYLTFSTISLRRNIMSIETLKNTMSSFINNTKEGSLSSEVLMKFETFVSENRENMELSFCLEGDKPTVTFHKSSFDITSLQWNIIDYFLILSDWDTLPEGKVKLHWLLREARHNQLKTFPEWNNQK